MTTQLIIRPCAIAEVEHAGRLPELLAAYADESRIPELGEPCADFATYRQMEACGAIHPIGAFAPELVGLATLLIYHLPHYAGRRVASLESFFVLPSARRTGAGLGLLRAARRRAKELGAKTLFISAPVDSRLAQLLNARRASRLTNHTFTESLE